MATYQYDPNDYDIYLYPLSKGNYLPIICCHINATMTVNDSFYSTSEYLYSNFRDFWASSAYKPSALADTVESSTFGDYSDENIIITSSSGSIAYSLLNVSSGNKLFTFTSGYPTDVPSTVSAGEVNGTCLYIAGVIDNTGAFFCNQYNFMFTTDRVSNDGWGSSNFTLPVQGVSKGHFNDVGFRFTIGTVNDKAYQSATNTVRRMLQQALLYDGDNPYPGGDEPDEPGNGSFDYTGDEIPIPDLPSISVCDSGFVSLFAPTESQLKALSSFMWSDTFSLDSFKKLFNDPMDCILGLSIVPVNVPTGSAREITVGNIVSTVSCNVVTNQFVSVDCGTLTISPTQFSGSYLDYAPYIKAYLYLPFIGVQPLNIDDVMNSTLHVVYHVDILTGACVCYVQATNRKTGGVSQPDAVLYTYMGQCSEPVPLSSQSYSGALSAIMQTAGIAGVAIGTVATGGASAPAAAAALTGLAGSTARTATSMKPSVQHGGSLMGSSGFMCTLYPYMIFDCPHTAIPQKQRIYTGYPSNKIVKLSSLSGFNVVQAINLTVDGATGTEMEEIKNYLESGVII